MESGMENSSRSAKDADPAASVSQVLADMRITYDQGTLRSADLAATPLDQFNFWFDEVRECGRIIEPNAMVVATADADGRPSSRTVLLKGVDDRGFTFFTNLHSRKSQELRVNPHASITFPWYELHRQVVVCGQVEELDRDEVANYFASRPHESQLGAWASEQSTVLKSREELDDRWVELHNEYPPDTPVPLPDFWGGWLVKPSTIEFWQGRPSRLHDRLRFSGGGSLSDASAWIVERLSP